MVIPSPGDWQVQRQSLDVSDCQLDRFFQKWSGDLLFQLNNLKDKEAEGTVNS
jgi:hypothetical protein